MMQPCLAGLLVGGIGYFGLPQVMGAGYGAIDQAMHSQFAWKMLLVLALFKLIATTLSFSSGTPGGMFAPTLFIGAMLGAAVGSFEKIYFPHLTGSIGSYALVGMGVLFAAFLRAPLTSVFMVLEVSGNYSIVLPVILANTIAYLVSRVLEPVPILEQFTHQDGLNLPSMEEQREESNLRLEDAMQPVTAPVLQGSESVENALQSLAQYPDGKNAPAIFIHCSDGLWYVAGKDELEALASNGIVDESGIASDNSSERPAATLSERLGPERTPVLFPDLPLSSALPHFQRWPMLPVTNRAMHGSLEGTVTLQTVLDRYQRHERG
jgi:CIC family chloride channel protein